MVVCSIRLRISRAVAIGEVLLQLTVARTFVRNQSGIKTGHTKHARLGGTPADSPKLLDEVRELLAFAKPVFRIEPLHE